MTLFEKSLKILELPNILELLAAEAVSDTAKDATLVLRPYTDFHTVQTNLDETTAAKNMMILRQSPPFSGVKDIRASIKRADMGGILSTRELLDVAQLLRASSSSIAYFTNVKEVEETAIDYLFSALYSNKSLEDKITTAIISEEEISDNASRELADIRRHMRIAAEKVRQTLNKIITSPTYSKALQEPIITMRNDRYVVPVKAEYKASLPGLVHDVSATGATQFIEPMAVVNINNEMRELVAREKQEIERILMELSADTAKYSTGIINDFEILAKLDFIFAKAKLSYKLDATEPKISEDMIVILENARHPLLPKKEAVPIDIRLGGEFDTLVITGPNTGGKTVTLKTLGLLCAMTQCGLHIPVNDGSIVPVFGSILADIGDEQSIEQSLSTFSSHMTNIIGMLENSSYDSLMMFDELGAGTDPVEGAALAISIIEHARKKSALIAATTHYAELKSYAVTSKGVMNASCEFDVETLRPTYKLIIGIPGKSNAFAISKRLGLPDVVIEDAKARVSTESVAFEDALNDLENTRRLLESEKNQARKLRLKANEDSLKAEEIKKHLDKERGKAVVTAKREAAYIIDEARKTADSVMNDLQKMQQQAIKDADLKKLNDAKADMFRELNEAKSSLGAIHEETKSPPLDEKIVPGNRVKLLSLGTLADVISVSPDGVLSLQAGIMKITAKQSEVSLVENDMQPDIKNHIRKSEAKLREMTAKPEVDLRGMNVDEAIPILERFIDNARMAKLHAVTIIHGKGTGVLRKAVHNSLRREQRGIKSFRLGIYGEGEDGVTVVEL
ncbi:MAG: endonuclease MutS2 [Oscillospiraceae bacterium]|jgi:DNA mismatch repair protein MutS2|nr:endonuclease MutS2 [Oscillospiraceae bacterium]